MNCKNEKIRCIEMNSGVLCPAMLAEAIIVMKTSFTYCFCTAYFFFYSLLHSSFFCFKVPPNVLRNCIIYEKIITISVLFISQIQIPPRITLSKISSSIISKILGITIDPKLCFYSII